MKINFEVAKEQSLKNLKTLKSEMNSIFSSYNSLNENICVYVCGSLGRLEMIQKTDLDLFFVSEEKDLNSNISNYVFFANLYKINKKLGYKEPSKRGEYWVFTPKDNLLDIGSRQEDFNNSFTARMLLILESKPIYNENVYMELVKEVVEKYFTDYKDHSGEFYPLFLMNDILRYWYTLTLNYEYRRDEKDDEDTKNWKRLKLKYARLITCFSMLACLYKRNISPEDVIQYILMTPFERLDEISTSSEDIQNIVNEIKIEYEWFLSLKNEDPNWWTLPDNKATAIKKADEFHKLVVHKLMEKVSDTNKNLKDKTDVY